MNTVERARWRWKTILPRLGIAAKFLVNQHGPCPICGGKDRYRFDDLHGEGTYFCNQCGAGTGLMLVRKFRKWDFATACREIDQIIGNGNIPPPSPPSEAMKKASRAADVIRRTLAEARSRSVVDAYLARRGITVRSAVLRGHDDCPYFDTNHRFVDRYPAVVAPVIGPDGSLQSCQRIYDWDISPRKKLLPCVSTVSGAAVRLHEVGEEMGVAEGVETALAAYEMFGIPTWAAISAGGIASFEPPAGLKRLHVYADHDSNFVGQQAAYALAQRLTQRGIEVSIHIPPAVDTDWNDVLIEQGDPA
jgi:putative DNA primase/helicase